VTDNLGFGLGGVIGGLIATTTVPASFTLLFLLDAGTFVAFIGMLAFVPAPAQTEEAGPAVRGGYRAVLRDRSYVALITLTAVIVAAAYAQLSALLPPFAKDDAKVSEAGIGVIFLVNTLFIAVLQLPAAKLIEGRRRMPTLALTGAVWAIACLCVLGGGLWFAAAAATVAIALAACVQGVGECLHAVVVAPLVADLAPARLLGRYMGLVTLSTQIGLTLGPAIGGFVLERSATALWVGAAAAVLAAAAGMLALEPKVPLEARQTPAEAPAAA
jgi:MFS family permease